MKHKASKLFKLAYFLTLGTTIILPIVFSQSYSWLGLLLAGRFFEPKIFFFVGLTLFWGYRIAVILRDPAALDIYLTGLFSKSFYFTALLCIGLGLFSMFGLFLFALPAVLERVFATPNNFSLNFSLAILLYYLFPLGIFGVALFEAVRWAGNRTVHS